MTKVFLIVLTLAISINSYWTYRLVKFAPRLGEQVKFLTLQSQCQAERNSEQNQQIFLLTKNKLLSKQVTGGYNTHLDGCRKYAEYMCWVGNSIEEVTKCREDGIKSGRFIQ